MFFLLSCEHLAAHTRLLGLLYRVSSKHIYVLFVEANKRELFFFFSGNKCFSLPFLAHKILVCSRQ